MLSGCLKGLSCFHAATMPQGSVSHNLQPSGVSRAATLSGTEAAHFRGLVAEGLETYGLTAVSAVNHDCVRQNELPIWIGCPCRRNEHGEPTRSSRIRNALVPTRSISYREAVAVLHLVDNAIKTREWRRNWIQSNPRLRRDPWQIKAAYTRAFFCDCAGFTRPHRRLITDPATGRTALALSIASMMATTWEE